MTDAAGPTTDDTLAAALCRWEIALPDAQVAQLEQYARLLWKWNERLNLTRHVDFERFVTRDVVDSVELARLLAADETVLDVGTGGGVPGVPVAIVRPDVRVSLCESVGKKAAAVAEIVAELDLPVPVHHARVEDVLSSFRYDVLLVRAVAPLAKLLRWLAPHWGQIGRLLVVKGARWVEERGEARHLGLLKPLELRRVAQYETPGVGAKNTILQLWPKSRP